jgi:hypothetical protein
VPAIPPPHAGLNPARYGRIRTGGSGVMSRAILSCDAREILGFITHRGDYDKSDWLRCPQTQFKVRFTPRLQVRHGYRYGCLLTSKLLRPLAARFRRSCNVR